MIEPPSSMILFQSRPKYFVDVLQIFFRCVYFVWRLNEHTYSWLVSSSTTLLIHKLIQRRTFLQKQLQRLQRTGGKWKCWQRSCCVLRCQKSSMVKTYLWQSQSKFKQMFSHVSWSQTLTTIWLDWVTIQNIL